MVRVRLRCPPVVVQMGVTDLTGTRNPRKCGNVQSRRNDDKEEAKGFSLIKEEGYEGVVSF